VPDDFQEGLFTGLGKDLVPNRESSLGGRHIRVEDQGRRRLIFHDENSLLNDWHQL
jgi:hypothetical protein